MAHTQTHPALLSSQREAFNSSGGKKLGVRERRRKEAKEKKAEEEEKKGEEKKAEEKEAEEKENREGRRHFLQNK